MDEELRQSLKLKFREHLKDMLEKIDDDYKGTPDYWKVINLYRLDCADLYMALSMCMELPYEKAIEPVTAEDTKLNYIKLLIKKRKGEFKPEFYNGDNDAKKRC